MTAVIIGLTIVASFFAWNRSDIHDLWIMYPYRVKRNKEYFRFLTSGFIHSGYVHLGFNMLSLYYFGTYVENSMGKFVFLIFYLLGIIVSEIPTFLKQQNHAGYRSLGASGGVAAIIFSSILLNPLTEIGFILLPGIHISGFIFGIVYLIYSYYQAKNSSDNIGHEAHFYGALFGLVFTVVLYPEVLGSFAEKISHWSLF